MKKVTPLIERFVEKFEVDPVSGCWLWTAGQDGHGYGKCSVCERGVWRSKKAHRVSYELFVGAIPTGMQIDHVRARGCTSRRCINPDHLEPVTNRENTLRGRAPEVNAARQRAIERCPSGHTYDELNTYVTPLGKRMCRACNVEAQRRYRDRRAA